MLKLILVLCSFFQQTTKSEDFIVHHLKSDSVNAIRIIKYLETYAPSVHKLTGNKPRKPHFFIEDIGTIPNGYSDPISNTISLFNYVPNPDFHFGTMKSWWRTVSVHEYTHHSHLTNVKFPVKPLRYILGKFYLPNALFSKEFMMEGLAVYKESSLFPYEGRLNEGYYNAYIRLLNSKNKIRPGVYIEHNPPDYPGGEITYLMGSEFVKYIAKKYGDERIKRHINIISRMPFTIPLVDVPAIIAYGKPLSYIWRDWRRELRDEKEYISPPVYLDKGYYISGLTVYDNKLYYVKTIYKRLSWDFTYSESFLCEMDLHNYVKRVLYTGNITLPPRIGESGIFIGIQDFEMGKENISYYGIKLSNTILKISKNGSKEVLIKGRIRAFDIASDTLYYAEDTPNGSKLIKYYNGEKHTIKEFEDIKVNQIICGNPIYLLAYYEEKGNGVYELSPSGELKKILSFQFNIGSLYKTGNLIYFSANYQNKWKIYEYDLQQKTLNVFEDELLAFYPAVDSKNLYYVSIDIDGELLKSVSRNNFKETKIEGPKEEPQNPSTTGELQYATKKPSYNFFTELLWPDFILPIPIVDSSENLAGQRINFLIMASGHSPLNWIEYTLNLNTESPELSSAIIYYNGIPQTSIGIQLSRLRKYNGFAFARIVNLKGEGYLWQTNLYFDLFPFAKYFSTALTVQCKIKPDIQQYTQVSFEYFDNKLIPSLSHVSFLPINRFALLKGSLVASFDPLQKELYHGENLRFTLPILKINWGNDAIIHFFYERAFVSFEYGRIRADNAMENYWALTHDHLFSIINGNLKFVLRLGIGAKNAVPTLVLGIEPASFNFSHGLFRKRRLLREFTGMPNLL